MQSTVATPQSLRQKILRFNQTLGPGIMMAAAAVGGSHLVALTQAGAIYGWGLVILILLVNLLKYPFFLAGVQYTMGTGKSLIEGYAEMGKPYLVVFTALVGFSSVVSAAALLIFSASLLSIFLPFGLPMLALASIITLICLGILIGGHFSTLDSISKGIMLSLTVATIAAVIVALFNPATQLEGFESPSPWTLASIGFLVATMGWMPAPMDMAAINTMWLKRHLDSKPEMSASSAVFDFNVGYLSTALLAVVFIALGALVMHGTGIELQKSGAGFAHQLVDLYASTIGEWARYLIAIIAFACIFGSTLTAIDGYARTLSECQRLQLKRQFAPHQVYNGWVLFISLTGMAIITFFATSLMAMLNFAMIAAFSTAPVLALLNYLLVSRTELPQELALSPALKALSMAGLVFLSAFLVGFIWWKWLM